MVCMLISLSMAFFHVCLAARIRRIKTYEKRQWQWVILECLEGKGGISRSFFLHLVFEMRFSKDVYIWDFLCQFYRAFIIQRLWVIYRSTRGPWYFSHLSSMLLTERPDCFFIYVYDILIRYTLNVAKPTTLQISHCTKSGNKLFACISLIVFTIENVSNESS